MKKQSMILILVVLLIGSMALALTACDSRYTVTWDVNGTITTEKYEAGAIPEFKGSTDREGDETTTYTFIGWDSEVVAVTGDVTYTAKYTVTQQVTDKNFAGLGSFTGTLVDGKLSGTGKLVDADGNVYEGTFANNMRSGTGKLTFTNGCYYEGEWANNMYEGQGKFYWPTESGEYEILEGTFAAGAPVTGKKTFATGYVYEGEWENWTFHGTGKGTYPAGDVYEGEFANGVRSGHGKLTYPDGCVYEGNFENDTFHGQGKFTWPNGCSYEGQFTNGAFTGKATFTWDFGEKGYSYYVGDMVNNAANGEGEKHFGRPDTNENYWKGTFENGDPKKGTYGFGRMDGTEGYIWVDATSGAWSWYNGQLADGTVVTNGQVAK